MHTVLETGVNSVSLFGDGELAGKGTYNQCNVLQVLEVALCGYIGRQHQHQQQHQHQYEHVCYCTYE